jgi:2-polyprenyl-6-methoxyphenol hydroxylase and related FAD-dependent oxidoreductases
MTRLGEKSESTAPPGSSGITTIIVGLGIAGLTAAIECHRKGHTVLAFEKAGPASHIGSVPFSSDSRIILLTCSLKR